MRKRYNFLEHADYDQGDVIEIENLRMMSCFKILSVFWHYEMLFGKFSGWEYIIFFSYVMMAYPEWIKIESFSDMQKQAASKLNSLRKEQDVDTYFKNQISLILERRSDFSKAMPGLGF